MPIFTLPVSSTAATSAIATPPVASTANGASIGGAFQNLISRTVNGVAEIGPGILNAFVLSRAVRDNGVSNVLAASASAPGSTPIQTEPVSQAPAPTANDLSAALNGSGGFNITPQMAILGGGGILLAAALLR